MLSSNIGHYLRAARREAGLLQHQVAKYLDIADNAYQRYEYGTRIPDIVTLDRLADLYGITLDQLVGRERISVVELE